MNDPDARFRIWAAISALFLLFAVAIASLLPLIETNIWWIRFLDFPRAQLTIATLVLLALYLALRGRPRRLEWIVVFGALGALGYQAYKLHPYTELVAQTAVAPPLGEVDCTEARALRVMIANVMRSNENFDAFLVQVAATDPDVLLVMETDVWWDEQLAPLRDQFQHQVQSIPDDDATYGMHLFSKFQLISPEFRFFFGADTPTVVAQLQLPGGEKIEFIGLHPRPPLAWSQPTTMRDAHILQAALMARVSDVPTILAGDLNAVPWERITRRAMRIGDLLDPRIGRALFPTYHAQGYLISWPLDTILFQRQLSLQSFRILPDFGSDHRAVVATLCHDPAAARDAPEFLAEDFAEAAASFRAARRIQEASKD